MVDNFFLGKIIHRNETLCLFLTVHLNPSFLKGEKHRARMKLKAQNAYEEVQKFRFRTAS